MFKYTIAFLPGAVVMRQSNPDGASAIVQEDVIAQPGPPVQPPRVRPPVQMTPIFHQEPDRGIAGYLYTLGPQPIME